MSQEALLTAVRDTLRGVLGLSAAACDVTFDGSPPAVSDVFYAVHYGDWTNHGSEALDERYGVNVTVSLRVGSVPWDRIGSELVAKARKGLEALCGKVRLAVVQNEVAIVEAANAIVNADAPHGRVSACVDDGNGFVSVATVGPHGLATGAVVQLVGTGYDSTYHGVAVTGPTAFTISAAHASDTAGGTFQALTANGFVEPLRFRDGGRPDVRGGRWFKARKEAETAGLSQTLSFRDARRVQKVEEAT